MVKRWLKWCLRMVQDDDNCFSGDFSTSKWVGHSHLPTSALQPMAGVIRSSITLVRIVVLRLPVICAQKFKIEVAIKTPIIKTLMIQNDAESNNHVESALLEK